MNKIRTVKVIRGKDVIIEEGAIVGYPKTKDPVILEDGAYIHSGAVIYSGCRIGKHTHIYHNTVLLEATLVGHHTKIGALCHSHGHCKIGNFVTAVSLCHFTTYMEIQDGVLLGSGVDTANSMYPNSRIHPKHLGKIEPIVIEKGARVGGATVINPGVVIGQEALVGSGSVVTKSIPAFAIAYGVPAKVAGEVPPEDRIDWDLTLSKFPNK